MSDRGAGADAPLTREQLAAIDRAKSMKLMPFKPRMMPGQIALRRVARIMWLLMCVAVLYAGIRSPGWVAIPEFVAPLCLLFGLILWLIAGPLGRVQARRLVLQHQGLVCPACHYALESIGDRGMCPECATAFDTEAVLASWRWAYRLRELPRPNSEDMATLVARFRAGAAGKDKPVAGANDEPHDKRPTN